MTDTSNAQITTASPHRSMPIEDYFPFPTIRKGQQRALDGIVKAETLGKEFLVMELPTGIGKSGLAIAAAGWMADRSYDGYSAGAHITTSLLILQKQYLRDFEERGMVELKGSSNYQCADFDTDCSSGSKLRKALKEKREAAGEEGGGGCSGCPYKAAKGAYLSNPLGITNLAYLINETRYVNQLTPRNLLIVDEAHNTEGALIGFADMEITKNRCEEFGISLPSTANLGGDDPKKVQAWIAKEFNPAGTKVENGLKMMMADAMDQHDRALALALAKKHDAVDKYLCRVRRFMDDPKPEEWFISRDDKNNLKVKPLYARDFAHELLFKTGKMKILMSATILDKKTFARNLGIPFEKAGFLQLPSEFPVENRPIVFFPVGSMSFKNKEATLPKMLEVLEHLFKKHSTQKGIIHCQSYQLQQAILDHFYGTDHYKRLLAPKSGSIERDGAILTHASSPEPTVLLSPSMTEGLDLKEDLSRWQVIAKTPFMSLGDAYIKRRMDLDPGWYDWQTAITLVQATGRSVRSDKDVAKTYILDSDFGPFLTKAIKRGILPEWWTDSIIFK